MAEFEPKKHTANEFNNGVQYVGYDLETGIKGDEIAVDAINNLIESALYSQQQAESANELANSVVTKAFAPPLVGMHHIQFSGEPTPAEIWGGTTWEIDTDYQGRTIIGSGGDYTLGATGGYTEHRHSSGSLGAQISFNTASTIDLNSSASIEAWRTNWRINVGERTTSTTYHGDGVPVGGNTDYSTSMQPYKVANYWKRTA